MADVPSIIRKQEYLRGLVEALDKEGVTEYRFVPPSGRGHFMLVMDVDGKETKIALPGTPSGHGEAKFYVVSNARREIRRMRELIKTEKKVDTKA